MAKAELFQDKVLLKVFSRQAKAEQRQAKLKDSQVPKNKDRAALAVKQEDNKDFQGKVSAVGKDLAARAAVPIRVV